MRGRVITRTGEMARHPWPGSCFIQGGHGTVPGSGGQPYQTAFVEVFPGTTFLRGEGATIAEAEDDCWQQYQMLCGCPHDQGWDRREYCNGSAYCAGCGTWFPRSFTKLAELPPGRPGEPPPQGAPAAAATRKGP